MLQQSPDKAFTAAGRALSSRTVECGNQVVTVCSATSRTKRSLTCNDYFSLVKNYSSKHSSKYSTIDVLRLPWRNSLILFVIVVIQEDGHDNGCCSSFLPYPTTISTYSALEETAAVTSGEKEINSIEPHLVRLTANQSLRRYHSVNES